MMEKFQNLALLIDAENIALDKLESVIQKTSAYGRIVIQSIRELIKTLQKAGVLVALITGKGDKSCRITLEQFGMRNLFCSIKTGTEDKPNKAEAIEELLHDFRLNKDEFYYIGDAVSDVAACNKAGVTCLSAAWATTADVSGLKKANPSKVFPSIKELTLFLSIEK